MKTTALTSITATSISTSTSTSTATGTGTATTTTKQKLKPIAIPRATAATAVVATTTISSTATKTKTIIYLPPFCYPCKQYVPETTRIRRTSALTSTSDRNISGSYGSCCQRRWEHKNYDKHDMTTTTTTTTTTTSSTTTTAAATTTMTPAAHTTSLGKPTKTTRRLREGVEKAKYQVVGVENRIKKNSKGDNSQSGGGVVVGVNGCYKLWNLQQQQNLKSLTTTADIKQQTTYFDIDVNEPAKFRTPTSVLQQKHQEEQHYINDDVIHRHNIELLDEDENHSTVDVANADSNPQNNIRLRTSKLAMPIVGAIKLKKAHQQQEREMTNSMTNTAMRHKRQPLENHVMDAAINMQTTKNTQTTITAKEMIRTAPATSMSLSLSLSKALDEVDVCSRCFKYNGDISACEQVNKLDEMEQMTGANNKWVSNLMQEKTQHNACERRHCWQQLLLQKVTQKLVSLITITPIIKRATNATMTTSIAATKSWLSLFMMLLLTSTASCWGGRQDVPTNCTFPARWEGSWFLSGYQQAIHIKGSSFSYRGRCAASDGNKYLIVDEKGCHRCLVIYEKHKNVLQYKESECEGDSMYMHQSNPSALAMRSSSTSLNKQNVGDHRGGAHPNTNGHSRLSSSDQYIMRSNDDMNDYFCKGRETLQNLCDQIPGDALLYSLFRESAEPVKCPLKGPFIFTYNRGHGECKSPVSNIESCTEESRLLLSFQACPDVQGTESTVEELTCLATWKDGNSRYLVGLVSHHHAISNEERYRCFVYEKISSLMGGPSLITSKDAEYKLAQSGDATCNGLDSAEVGSRIMSLRKPPLAERCDFPVWFKGPRHWHALMGNAVYNYHSNDGSVHIIKPNGYMETRALCEQINKQTATEMMAVVHYTTGCQSGFMCMMFYRRDTHVIEIQTGKQAVRLEDACAPDHFDINKMAYITLLASNPDPQICPMEGLYNLRGAIGPPYLATRHKRNHNNKVHIGHAHHHHESELNNGGGHKQHSTLSFRSTERGERSSWHANTRGLPVRSRRNANLAEATDSTTKEILLSTAPINETSTMSVGFVTRNRRDVPGCVTNYKAQRQLWVGCTQPNVIDVRPLCNEDGEEEYSCHGSWTENGTHYIIARHKSTKHGVCISYRPTEGNAAKLVIGDACYRGTQKPPDHHLVANLSVFGKCGETGSGTLRIHIPNWSLLAWTSTMSVLISISIMHRLATFR